MDGKGENDGGKLDPLETKQIHGSKQTNSHKTNGSQKKIGAIFGGDFRIWARTHKIKARNEGAGLQFREKPWLLIPYDVGQNPIWRSFTNWRGILQ